MELKLKKRIIGFTVLIAMGLILFPLFFGRSVSSEELELSSHVPEPPPEPNNLSLPIPSKTAPESVIEENNVNVSSSISPVVREPLTPSSSAQMSKIPGTSTPSLAIPELKPTVPEISAIPENALKIPVISPIQEAAQSTVQNKAQAKLPNTAPVLAAWTVQLGSFSDKLNAQNLMKKLQAQGFSAYMRTSRTSHGSLMKVFVGPELRRSDAENSLLRLEKLFNLKGMVIKAGS